MKNLKLYISIVGLSIFSLNQAQVVIGAENPHPSAVFDLVATDKGVRLPQVHLGSLTDAITIPNLVDGIMVYNLTANSELQPGYYFWKNNQWIRQGESIRTTIINDGTLRKTLGYVPNGAHTQIPEGTSQAYGGASFTNVKCEQWTSGDKANGHYYCAYNINKGITWKEAFNFAKSLNGYLVTLTNDDETAFVKNNLIDRADVNDGNIWIGNAKVTNRAFDINTPSPGINYTFRWITGEISARKWNNAAKVEENFAEGEPNNNGDNEGCVFIWSKSFDQRNDTTFTKFKNVAHLWNDDQCTITSQAQPRISGLGTRPNRNHNVVIVEFHQ